MFNGAYSTLNIDNKKASDYDSFFACDNWLTEYVLFISLRWLHSDRSLNTEFHTGNNITREILNQVQDDGLVQDNGVVQDDGGYSE